MYSRDDLTSYISQQEFTDLAVEDLESCVSVYGYGLERVCVSDPKTEHVLKLSIDPNTPQNTTEVQIWNEISETDLAPYFLPVLESVDNDTGIIVPKATDFDGAMGELYRGPKAIEYKKLFHECGFTVGELETARYNGDIVAADYGGLEKSNVKSNTKISFIVDQFQNDTLF